MCTGAEACALLCAASGVALRAGALYLGGGGQPGVSSETAAQPASAAVVTTGKVKRQRLRNRVAEAGITISCKKVVRIVTFPAGKKMGLLFGNPIFMAGSRCGLDTCGCSQCSCFVGLFPAKFWLIAAKVPIGSSFAVDGAL